jgi:hypothetical protein
MCADMRAGEEWRTSDLFSLWIDFTMEPDFQSNGLQYHLSWREITE